MEEKKTTRSTRNEKGAKAEKSQEERIAKFNEKLQELLSLAKKEEEHFGVSGDQRFLQRAGTGCGTV